VIFHQAPMGSLATSEAPPVAGRRICRRPATPGRAMPEMPLPPRYPRHHALSRTPALVGPAGRRGGKAEGHRRGEGSKR